ncbi:hypothetical protein DPMN_004060 [Dreissena polymorpha]|uniref:Uncharacterized protein n=1 Tax=Dreissena polymorpha TaxID=45954 RepID=A0A9D4MM46_DREPO|nr:hypothetical protein DPMN_004060 [Dreissena polymorpha]
MKDIPMFELYRNINIDPNPFTIVPGEDDDDDSDDDTVFKFPPPAKYRQGIKYKKHWPCYAVVILLTFRLSPI